MKCVFLAILCVPCNSSFIYFILDDSMRINLHLLIKVHVIAIIILVNGVVFRQR